MSIEPGRICCIATFLSAAMFAALAGAAGNGNVGRSEERSSPFPVAGAELPPALIEGDACPPTTSIVNDPQEVWALSKFKIAAIPDLQIGSEASGSPTDFSAIHYAAQLNGSGRIAVLDFDSKEIRIFSGTGQFLKRVGGRGEGPGEFQNPFLVPVAGRYDSIVVVDYLARRVSAFSAEGVLTSMRRTGRLPGGGMLGFLKQGNLVHTSSFGGVGGSRTRSSIRYQVSDLTLLALDADTVRSIQLANDSTPSIAIMLPSRPNTVYAGAWIPFRVPTSSAIGANLIVTTIGSRAIIREFDSAGCLSRLISVAGPLRPIPPGEYERWVEWGISRVPSKDEARRLYGEVPRPSGLPAWQKLLVDSEGFVWAEEFRVQNDTTSLPRWNVFAPDGKAAGTVAMPVHLDVSQVGRDFVLGVWKDANDIEYVRRYPLTRTP